MELEDKYSANVYHKRPVVIVRGRGAEVWDLNGKKYVDCVAGHGVAILGHCHPRIVEAVKKQVERLITCPGTFYNDVRAKLLEKVAEISLNGLDKSFLSNSGAEAVECAIKLSKAYTGRKKIISTVRGFHGRTLGALSLTWKPEYRNPFKPLLQGVVHVPFGKEESVKEIVNKDTAAVVVEPIQGEGGVIFPPDNYLKALREICDDHGAVLVFDEVQTGFGRTGRMFACQHWKVTPDIICLAKGFAGGVPIGITIARGEIMDSFKPGMHGSTYGGNPLACAAALAAIEALIEEKLPERACRMGLFFKKGLEKLKEKHKVIREVRGLGLMLAVQFKLGIVRDVVLKAIDGGVLLLPTGRNVVRMLPPLMIEKNHVSTVLEVLDDVLSEFKL